jgi:hypothetical protein
MRVGTVACGVHLAGPSLAWGQAACAAAPDIARRELTRKRLKVKGENATGRNVLFQELKAGLKRDELGEWGGIGRLTPEPRETRCRSNPAPGISSIPLKALANTPTTGVAPGSEHRGRK